MQSTNCVCAAHKKFLKWKNIPLVSSLTELKQLYYSYLYNSNLYIVNNKIKSQVIWYIQGSYGVLVWWVKVNRLVSEDPLPKQYLLWSAELIA